ncbi:MAG TPA: hypothetical protein VM261_14105 [Kofleriaceae bacterium]|nr:hypothetical protein [Kofleriaceae bacterium]
MLLNPFRGNVREFRILTRVLADLGGDVLEAVEGYYAPDIDAALIGACFSSDARLRLGVAGMQASVARCGLPMVVPARLEVATARRFFDEHLLRYDTYVQLYPSAAEPMGLFERIVERLGEQVALRPRAGTDSDYNFDLRHEVPVIGARHATMPSWRRAESSC